MKNLILLLLLLLPASAFAGQSVTFNGTSQYTTRTLSNSSPYTSVGAWRAEMRLTDIGAGSSQKIFDTDHFYIKLNASTGTLTIFSWDSEITGATLDVSGFASHLTDITVRVQRDPTNSRYTVEAWDSAGSTRFASGTGAATGMVSRNYGNTTAYIGARSVDNSGSAGEYYNGRVAFLRWYSTLVDYSSAIKPTLAANSAQLLQMEYEGNLNDSSVNAQHFTGVNSPTFNTTPTINPIANAGADVGGRIAGVTFSLDCSNSSAGEAPITSYSWTRLSGTGTISSPTSAVTNITGIGSGQSTFQCQVGDGTNTATDSVDVGVVAVNGDGTVQISDSTVAFIIGPQVPYSSAASLVLPYYDANIEEGYTAKRNTPSVAPRVDPAGTLSVANGSANVVGTGTLFTKHVAQRSPGGVDTPLTINGVAYTISSITDDTHLTLTTTYAGSTASGITDWGQDSSAEASDLFTSYWHYYDPTYNAYIAYYRSGLTKWLTEARRLADARWSAANIDYGAVTADNANAPREVALGGLILRALDGKPEYFDFCYRYVDYHYRSVWVMPRLNYRGLYFGTRDGGYVTLFMLWMSQALPSTYTLYGNGTLAASTGTATDGATKRANMLSDTINGVINYYIRLQRPDGSWRWTADESSLTVNSITNVAATVEVQSAQNFAVNTYDNVLFKATGDLKLDNEYMTYVKGHTFLQTAINASDTTIVTPANGTAFFPSSGKLQIQNEKMSYSGKTSNSFTGVVRGVDGTTATSHTASTGQYIHSNVLNITRGAYGTTAASHPSGVEAIDLSFGFYEQTFHVGVGLGHAMRDLLRLLQGNPTYATEYNTIRNALLLNAAEGMLAGYDSGPVGDTPSINARRIAYALHSWGDWGTSRDGMPDTITPWPTIVDLRDARQNIVTWTHMLADAYHYSGVPWYRDQLDEVLSANWGKTGYSGTIGTSDGYYALQDYFTPGNNRRQKEHNEWHRTVGSAFAWRAITPETPANRAPFVSIDGGDRVLANGTVNPSFTARGIDPEGTAVTYSWTNAMGCSATLSGALTATVTITSALPDNTDCSLRVTATDAAGNSAWQWVMYRTRDPLREGEERPPVAAVTSQNVSLPAGTTSSSTALNLSSSTAFGGRSLKYRWVQVDGADAAVISNFKAANPTVSSLANGQTYVFHGYVWDNRTRTVEETGTDDIFVRVSVAAGASMVVCNWHTSPRCQ